MIENRRTFCTKHRLEMVTKPLLHCVKSLRENDRIFLIQVFLCLIATVVLALFLRLPKKDVKVSWKVQLRRIDFAGALLLVLAVTCLLFGLNRGSNVSWGDPMTITFLCVTIPLSIAFLGVETRFAAEPFTPGHVIFDKGLFACYVQNFFLYAAVTSQIFYLPLFFQVKLGMTPTQAGAALIPAAISAVLGTVVGGYVMKRTGRFYWLTQFASTAAVLGTVPFVVAPSLHHGSLACIFIGCVLSLVSSGVTIVASLLAISEPNTP